jgi:hypothetical protein
VNAQVNDPHAAIGPSHFLLKDTRGLNEAKAEVIWEHSVLPVRSRAVREEPAAAREKVRQRMTTTPRRLTLTEFRPFRGQRLTAWERDEIRRLHTGS